MKEYEKQLERDTQSEKAKHQRNMEQLAQRKEEMVRQQRQKIKDEIEAASKGGATKDEQERLLEEHNRNLEKLVNKIDTDKIRMESHLQVTDIK